MAHLKLSSSMNRPTWRAALNHVTNERDKQDEYKAAGRFRFTCADHGLTLGEKLAVLTEEIGEVANLDNANPMLARLTKELGDVARNVLTHNRHVMCYDTPETSDDELLKELVQVAAVALSWVESLL